MSTSLLPAAPIVLSSNHTSPVTKSTRLIQDGDRYIFLVEENRSSKVSSPNVGADSRAARSTDDTAEVTADDEEGEETGKFHFEICFKSCWAQLLNAG